MDLVYDRGGRCSAIHRNWEFGVRAWSCTVLDILRLEDILLSGGGNPRSLLVNVQEGICREIETPAPGQKSIQQGVRGYQGSHISQ